MLDTLYAQLASLRDRTVELERQYRIGEQAAQERAAREARCGRGSRCGRRRRRRERRRRRAAARRRRRPSRAPRRTPRAGCRAYGWGCDQFRCLDLLWTRESGWRADAYNASSGAYGIPQSLPGSKMASAGADWRTNAATQIDWGLGYIDATVRLALRRMGALGGVQLVLMLDHDEREVFRRHGAEGVLLAGGGAAILLQLADPRVARGVAAHSGFRERPLDRLLGTLDYVYAVGFGDDDTVAAAVRAVNARHVPVRGAADGGRPAYSAFDADAQRWVASTLLGVALGAPRAPLGPARRADRRRGGARVRAHRVPPPGDPRGLARDASGVRPLVDRAARPPRGRRRGPIRGPLAPVGRIATSPSAPRSCCRPSG